jgi:nicotinamide riboside kinase
VGLARLAAARAAGGPWLSARALIIAILGAESTGKTTLAAALAAGLSSQGVPRVAWVPELLREWCTAQGRTPRCDEQAGILQAQNERIAAAAAKPRRGGL